MVNELRRLTHGTSGEKMDLNKLIDVRGKTALVTGASGGIGLMIASGLVDAGCRVLICSRNREQITAVADELSARGTAIPFVADLSTPEGITRTAEVVAPDQPLRASSTSAGTSARRWRAITSL
jgi:NAD(P)-dependent dehydrogenase (short-subunit alcohol dehydrogenase family)